jgi:hypothetical protein
MEAIVGLLLTHVPDVLAFEKVKLPTQIALESNEIKGAATTCNAFVLSEVHPVDVSVNLKYVIPGESPVTSPFG